MNRVLRRRHRWSWVALVIVLIAIGVLAWRRADDLRSRQAAAVNPGRVSAAPLGDAVP